MAPFTLRWGIIATGGISTKFAEDLLTNPALRNVSDVAHKITAVGSRSVESAQKFIDRLKANPSPNQWGVDGTNEWGLQNGVLDDVKACGSYADVFSDPNVDAVYIGTPHTFHHANARDALLAGKHVLCEKPFTFDVSELDELIQIAHEKKLFLMEAVWTRFHPIAYALQDLLKSGKLGAIKRMSADFSMNFAPDTRPDSNRMIDPEQGGGSLLDQGPYPSVWAMLAMHHHPDNKDKDPQVVSSYQRIYERSGVDSYSQWIVQWKGLGEAVCVTDMTASGYDDACVVISCEEADVVLSYPPWRPETLTIVPHASFEPGSIKERSSTKYPVAAKGAGGGMHYEADEVARCIRDGKTQSDRMPLAESRITQGWLDAVRKQGNTVLKERKPTVQA